MYNAGVEAGINWKSDYSSMLLSYDSAEVSKAMLSFCRLELFDAFEDADESTIYVLLCTAFVQLHKRGAIQQLRPLSSEGERQLSELLTNFNVVRAADIPAPIAEDPYSEVIADYHSLSSSEFNAKLRADRIYSKLFQEASDAGRL